MELESTMEDLTVLAEISDDNDNDADEFNKDLQKFIADLGNIEFPTYA